MFPEKLYMESMSVVSNSKESAVESIKAKTEDGSWKIIFTNSDQAKKSKIFSEKLVQVMCVVFFLNLRILSSSYETFS